MPRLHLDLPLRLGQRVAHPPDEQPADHDRADRSEREVHDDAVGRQYDRSPSTTPGMNWRSGPPSGSVSIQDALLALNQVGDVCG